MYVRREKGKAVLLSDDSDDGPDQGRALAMVPPRACPGSSHDFEPVSDNRSSRTDHGRKTRKRKRPASTSNRGTQQRNETKEDQIKDLEIEFYARLNRDYDDMRLPA